MAPVRMLVTTITAFVVVAAALLVRSGPDDAFAQPKLVTSLAVLGVGGLAVVHIVRRVPTITIVGADAAMAAWVLWTMLAWWRSPAPESGWMGQYPEYQGLAALLAYALIFWMVGFGRRPAVILPWIVVATGTTVAVYALVQYGGFDPVWDVAAGERTFSSLGLPTSAGAYLVMTVAVTAAMVPRARARRLLTTAVIVQVLAILSTQSRGAVLGLAAVLVVIGWRHRSLARDRIRWVPVLGVAGVLVVAGLGLGLTQANLNRLTSPGSAVSNGHHAALFQVGVETTMQNPLLGTGPDTFPYAYDRYAEQSLSDDQFASLAPFRPESPHNNLVAVASGAGLPALGFYLAAVALALAASRRWLAHSDPLLWTAVLAATAGHLVTDLFMTAEVAGSLLFWMLLGLGIDRVSGRPAGRATAAVKDVVIDQPEALIG